MSKLAFMPLYIGDYLADTAHLSTVQHGAYMLLIMHYWRQGSLPDDDEQLSRIAKLSLAEWRKHRSTLRSFFQEGWRHERIEQEIQAATAKYAKRAEAGRKGGKASRRSSNAQAGLNQSQSQPHPLRGRLSQGEQTSQGMALGEASSWPRLAVVNGEDEL